MDDTPPPGPAVRSPATAAKHDTPARAADAPAAAPAANEDGWVPASAAEAIAKDAVGANPPSGSDCEDRPDPIDLAKGIAGQMEGYVRSASEMSDSDEATIGNRLEAEMSKAEPFRGKWDLPADVARYGTYAQAMVEQLLKRGTRSGVHFRVHIVHDSAFNAFALPGGVLGVNTGLFEGKTRLRSESELAAVLGHEIAHVELRHPVAIFQFARAVLGQDADDAAIIIKMLETPISSEHEHEADVRGLELAALAQYDPFAACHMWQRQAQIEDGEKPRPTLGGLAGVVLGAAEKVLSSHPPAAQRCARTLSGATALMQTLPYARYYRGERNLNERLLGPNHPY